MLQQQAWFRITHRFGTWVDILVLGRKDETVGASTKGLRVVAGNDETPPNQNRLGNHSLKGLINWTSFLIFSLHGVIQPPFQDWLRAHCELVQLDISLFACCCQNACRSFRIFGDSEMGHAAWSWCHIHQTLPGHVTWNRVWSLGGMPGVLLKFFQTFEPNLQDCPKHPWKKKHPKWQKQKKRWTWDCQICIQKSRLATCWIGMEPWPSKIFGWKCRSATT